MPAYFSVRDQSNQLISFLAIGVVVAQLGTTHLVTHADHRHTHGHQGDAEQVFHQAGAHLLDRRVIGRPFHTAVGRVVVIGAVLVSPEVGLVVLVCVADQVVDGEPVVAGACPRTRSSNSKFVPLLSRPPISAGLPGCGSAAGQSAACRESSSPKAMSARRPMARISSSKPFPPR